MTTEIFTKAEFEHALQDIVTQNKILSWSERGLQAGEYRYHVIVKVFPNGTKAIVEIASSVGANGLAAETGENSIRIWLSDGKLPLGNKVQKYVTRVTGWQRRMADVLSLVIEMGNALQYCNTCKSVEHVFVVKNGKPENIGRLFAKCNCPNSFVWLDVQETKPAPKKNENAPKSPACPKCGGMMTLRNGKNGQFWGCRLYPACNGTLNANVEIEGDNVETPKKEGFAPSKYQQAIFDWVTSAKPGKALVVEALAGSGKTTTGVKLLNLIPSSKKVLFLAFNKHIAKELANRAPSHVKCSTCHSLGYNIIKQNVPGAEMVEDKVKFMLEGILDKNTKGYLFSTIRQVVSLVKANLAGFEDTDLVAICEHYGIETNGDAPIIFEAVRSIMQKCYQDNSTFDYDDMIWLPVVKGYPAMKYDVIFVDEAQDLNKAQIMLALMSVAETGNVIAVGDRHQSLYGFRGADVNAIPNIIEMLNADTLPLSITYRCPANVVKLINEKFQYIPLEAAESAKPGVIRSTFLDKAIAELKPGDMVICRCNAPLVKPAFALIRQGIKAIIRGRDIGTGLVSLVRKMKASSIIDLLAKLSEYKAKELAKLIAADKGTQAQALEDKVETIVALADGVSSVGELENRITMIFQEETEGVVFSSVHRAKGLEANRVYILNPELMPHPMAKLPWEMVQEANIEYVALSRTQGELIFVS